MPELTRPPYTYDEVDSEALPAAERFALWRETGRLPMAAEPSTAHLFIVAPLLSGASFANLFSTHPPMASRIQRLIGRSPV